jgi:TonB-linked SusC/RagA family outer membrane protein
MKRILFSLITLVSVLAMAAQNRTVTGTVVSADDGEPLIGVTVVPVGGGSAVATDFDGNFSIQVAPSVSKLKVSYVGMNTQEVEITSNHLKIALSSTDNSLDEVMVVAFGTAKKSAYTGSAAVVKSDEISKHTTSNVTDALVGSVAGLQIRGGSGAPGASEGSVNIRGIASLYAGTDPLVIVDGAPYSASLNNIPPGDIESVSVLKDAASAALYGARGAAGVIIVTTKKGNTRDAQISVDAKWGVSSRAIQEYDVIKDPAQYYETYYKQLYNYGFYGQGMTAQAANSWANTNMIKQLGYNIYTVPEGENLIGMNGKLNSNATLGRTYDFNGQQYYMINDDWNDLAYQNGFRQEYTVSANGAYERGSYYASLSYLDQDGVLEYSGYERIAARMRADYQAKSWLKLGTNIGYVHSNTRSNPNLSSDANSSNISSYTTYLAPIYPAYIRVIGADGNPVIKTDDYGNQAYDFGVASTNYGVTRPFLGTGNPLSANRYNKTDTQGNQLNGTFTLDVNFTDYLKFNATSNVIWGNTYATAYENGLYGSKVSVNGELTKTNTSTFRTNNSQTLTFTKDFGPHAVTALIGHEYYRSQVKYLGAKANGGFSPDIPELNAFANPLTTSSYTTNYNVEGYFASAQYSYDNKYFASGSFRRDASSYFAKSHRWGNFWSIGGAWLISKEDFLKDVSWLNELKVKASVGQQGNDQIGSYGYVDLYSLSANADKTSMSPSFYRIGNEDITWETTTNYNVGLEFGLFNSRLTGSLDWYYKKTADLLFWLSIPESMGSRGYYGNLGDIRNTGVELSLTGSIIRTRDYEWSVSANISHNSTKILKLPESKVGDNGGFFASSMWYAEGQPLYNYMTLAYAGVNDKGEALYYYDPNLMSASGSMNTSVPGTVKSKEYVTTETGKASRYASGSILPKAYGGFSTTIRIKSFDATASFDYQIGGKVYDSVYQSLMSPTGSTSEAGQNFHKDVLNSWSQDNTSSDLPRWQYGDQETSKSSDRWLTNASYLNFQSFTVGYTLPKNLIKQINSIRFYVSGENLCFWSARKGFDPRYSYSATESVTVYSPVRTVSGGVQVSF